MKIKTNLRAGAGANAGGVNSGGVNSSSATSSSTSTVDAAKGGKPVPVYVPPVYTGRCVGY